MQPTVLITDNDYETLEIEEGILSRYGVRLLTAQCRSEEDVIKAGQKAQVLINEYTPITAKVFAALPQVRGAIRYGKGYDSIDVKDLVRVAGVMQDALEAVGIPQITIKPEYIYFIFNVKVSKDA